MNYLIRFLTLLLLFLWATVSYSQNSGLNKRGYLGKKFFVEMTGNLLLSRANTEFNSPNFGEAKKNTLVGYSTALISPEISLNFFVRKNMVLGLEFGYLRHKYVLNNFRAYGHPNFIPLVLMITPILKEYNSNHRLISMNIPCLLPIKS